MRVYSSRHEFDTAKNASATLMAAAVLLSGLTAGAARAQTRPDAAYDSAVVAWDEGRYDDALARLERVLTAPGGDRFHGQAALLTGELFRTTELAPDGRLPRWSPGGRYVAFEVGAGPARRTHVLRAAEGGFTRSREVEGAPLVFAPGDGFAAYVTATGTVRDVALADGSERDIPTGGLRVRSLAYAPDGTLLAAAATARDTTTNLYTLGSSSPLTLTTGVGGKTIVGVADGALVYTVDRSTVAMLYSTGEVWAAPGGTPALSADGRFLAWVGRDGDQNAVMVKQVQGGMAARAVFRSPRPLANPALSPDGRLVAFQMMPREDWDIYVAGTDGSGLRRLTRDIQHDLFPVFLDGENVLAVMGEARHRRSYLYDLASGERTRFFHNNTVRTVAQEYQWAASPDGARVLVVADRDGDTVSPERGVYVTDRTRRVTMDELLARVRGALAAERDLRARGARMFAPVSGEVRRAVGDVSVARIDAYGRALYAMESKFVTEPGNRLAIDYLAAQLRSFGYEPELQWFEARGARTANVIATLRGTVNPDLTYVVSSHFDSVRDGPGADDNSSGTTALLEAARVLASRPQAATIQFAFFTGEEAGLLGSREYVRRAQAAGVRLVGALNNDMIGWRNDHRLDNTIRYSNDGLRDLQHAAAFLFTGLITYDSRYYQNTDAHAYYEVYGDIVAGIGSYPILGNPHYHQVHDVLETVDPRLVAEVSRTTVASLMLMASSPSRLGGVTVRVLAGRRAEVTWNAAAERGVTGYRVAYGPAEDPMRHEVVTRSPRAVLSGAGPGTRVAVRAIGPRRLEGWDWARGVVPSEQER